MAIWVSSVTRIGLPSRSTSLSSGHLSTICSYDKNSTGAPNASPSARPKRQPDDLLIVSIKKGLTPIDDRVERPVHRYHCCRIGDNICIMAEIWRDWNLAESY